MTETRVRIEQAIADIPGIHFNGLVRHLDLAPGQVQYHLRRLHEQGTVVSEQLYGRTQYYPPEYDAFDRAVIALLRRETARDILVYLLDRGRARPDEVTEAIGIARSTLEWHLDHLEPNDLVRKHQTERGVELVARHTKRVTRLLAETDPSVPLRMSDRFARLVDRLLEE